MSADMTTDLLKRLEAGERYWPPEIMSDLARALFDFNCTHKEWDLLDSAVHGNSIDAAVALVERVRPRCDWSVAKVGPKHRANLWMPSALRLMPSPHCTAPTPAAAILAALLRSMGEG